MSGWTAQDLPDQRGRTVVITGANSGIGLAAARELARVGARVVLAVRDEAKGRAAAADLPGTTEVRRLDLADLSSVRAFAADWDEPIDVLVNNAGVMAVPERRTPDGFELQMGTNHLGHFALTGLLLHRVSDRVVTIASSAHRTGKIVLDDLNWDRRRYQRWGAYGQAKLANLLFAFELQRRLSAAGSDVRSLAAHPGYAATNLQHRTESFQDAVMGVLNKLVAQSDAAGAWPTLYAATQPLPGGSYIGPGGPGEMRGSPRPVGASGRAQDVQMARDLWAASERLTGVSFEFGAPAAA